jgi:hypothetical protein
MELVCIQEFGSHKVGDVVELPDDAEFSPLYFAEKPKEEEAEKAPKARRRPANASDEATGTDTGNDKEND